MAVKPFTEKEIRETTDILVRNKGNFEIAALSELIGEYLYRIHNKREATDGSSLGAYVDDYWKQVRVANGRQIDEKDLEFSGNFRRSVKVGVSGGKNVMGYDNDLSRLIGLGQEAFIGKLIVPISVNEQKTLDKAFEKEVEFQLNKVLK